jgi:hypothetical protein
VIDSSTYKCPKCLDKGIIEWGETETSREYAVCDHIKHHLKEQGYEEVLDVERPTQEDK